MTARPHLIVVRCAPLGRRTLATNPPTVRAAQHRYRGFAHIASCPYCHACHTIAARAGFVVPACEQNLMAAMLTKGEDYEARGYFVSLVDVDNGGSAA